MAKLVQPYQIAIPKKLVKKIGFKSENKNDKADILSIKVEPTVFPNIYFETVMQEKGKMQVYSFGGIGLIYLSNINTQLFGHNKLKYGPVFDYYQTKTIYSILLPILLVFHIICRIDKILIILQIDDFI